MACLERIAPTPGINWPVACFGQASPVDLLDSARKQGHEKRPNPFRRLAAIAGPGCGNKIVSHAFLSMLGFNADDLQAPGEPPCRAASRNTSCPSRHKRRICNTAF
jgi:hypothetical protein